MVYSYIYVVLGENGSSAEVVLVFNAGHAYQTGCNSHPYWMSSGFSSCALISTTQGPDVMTWQQAHDQCVSINPWSTLAVLPTDEHDAVIASTAKNSTAYWVGIRVPSNSSWPYTWMDGTVETRNSIFPGNISSLVALGGSPSHLCGHVTLTIQPAHRQLSWSFGECQKGRPYICIVDSGHIDDTTTTGTPTTPPPTTTTVGTTKSSTSMTPASIPTVALNNAPSKHPTSARMTYGTAMEKMIKATLGCPHNTNAVQCLLATLSSSRLKQFADSDVIWKMSLLLIDGILRGLVSSPSTDVPSISEDFLHLLSTILQQTGEGRLPYSNQNAAKIHGAIDKFVDVLVTNAGHIPANSSIARFTSRHLEMNLTKEKIGNIRRKEMILKFAQINIDNVFDTTLQHPLPDADEITILAMVSDASEARSWLVDVDQRDRKSQEIRVTSPILTLSASVHGQLVSLEHRFRLTSHPYHKSSDNKKMTEPFCSFRLKDQNHSFWDTVGCQTILPKPNRGIDGYHNDSRDITTTGIMMTTMTTDQPLKSTECGRENNHSKAVECHCNHTTSFAIVMSVVNIKLDAANALALDIITYIGCGLTIVSMCIAITVFTCIRSLDSERVCIHRNLCVAILLSQLIFLMGVQAVDKKAVCRLVALMLHYFYMATFVWMLVEGLHLYSQVVRVFGTERSRVAYYVCFGWGFPFLEVAVSAAIDWEGYGTKRSCWLSIERTTIWAFVGPALSILFVNLLILTVVMRIIVLAAKVEKMDEIDHIKAGVKASLFLSPLLGVTWLFGLAAVNKDLLVFQYIFSILNSLQGFFIFLYHCVFNTDVRQTLKRMKEKRMLQRELGTSSGSSQRASCSENGTDLTPKQSTTPVFKRIRQVSPEMGNEKPGCQPGNTTHMSNKSSGMMLMHI